MAPHSSTLACKIPWTEELGGLQSMGSLRVGHDWATSLSLYIFMHWRRKWQSTPVFLPGESQGCGAWWAAVYGAAQSRTRLKRLSSSSPLQRSKWQLTPVFLPGESQGQTSLVGYLYGVAQSRTWLKWLSSSSSPLQEMFLDLPGLAHNLPYMATYQCYPVATSEHSSKRCSKSCFFVFNFLFYVGV